MMKASANRKVHFWLIAAMAPFGFLGAIYPSVDLSFRLLFSLFAFAIVFYVPREFFRQAWFWSVLSVIGVIHCGLLMYFWRLVASIDKWAWGAIVLVEMVVVTVVVLRFSPAEREFRKNQEMPTSHSGME